MDDLGRRLQHLAEDSGDPTVPRDLHRRVARRRRTRTALAAAGPVAGIVLAATAGLGVWSQQRPEVADPPVPACTALRPGTPQTVPGEPGAQDVPVALDRNSPVSCRVAGFRVTRADGSERARAGLTDVTLDPGDTVTLRVRWDAAATCATEPVELLAGSTVVASVALPTCGTVSLGAQRRPAS